MTTIFGNPGSTELPMLRRLPEPTSATCSGCRRRSWSGWPTASPRPSGRTTVVNLHTAPGVGNAMGAIFNAQANHSPLLITAGQQARAQITLQANLTNRDATRMPHPLVKWSYEPPRAEDVPLALAHGAHLAGLAPRGPVFVTLPMDDWERRGRRRRRPPRDHPQGDRPRRRRPGRGRGARGGARRGAQPGPRRRPRHRHRRRLGQRRSPSPSASTSRSGPRPRPAASASASPRTTRTSAASCRPRSARSARRSRATT